MPRYYFLIHARVIPLWAEWRRRHVKKFLALSRPLLFPLPNKDAHCNTGKWERKGGAANGGERERERLRKKSWPFMDVVTSSFAILALVLHSFSFSCSVSCSWWSHFHESGTPWAWTLNSVIKRKRFYFTLTHTVVCNTEYAFPYQDYRGGFHINW